MCELDLTSVHSKGLSLHVAFMLIPMLHNFKRESHAEILRKLARIVVVKNFPELTEPLDHGKCTVL